MIKITKFSLEAKMSTNSLDRLKLCQLAVKKVTNISCCKKVSAKNPN